MFPPVPPAYFCSQRVDAVASSSIGVGDALERRAADRFDRGMGTYVPPTGVEQQAFRSVVGDLLQALRGGCDLEGARAEAMRVGYQIEPFGGDVVVLRERDAVGRGWPTVFFHTRPRGGLVIEAPHPVFDWGTPELAWRAFEAFHAEVLVVAGTHRGNRAEPSPDVPHGGSLPEYSISDMTHARGTLFQAAHQAVTGPTSVVLQIHGFSARKHHEQVPAFPADRQVVLTDGADDGHDPPHLRAANDALQAAGYRSAIVTFEDPAGSQLGALPNVQARDLEERGLGRSAEFVHMELDTSLRRGEDREAQYERLTDALRPVFGAEPPAGAR